MNWKKIICLFKDHVVNPDDSNYLLKMKKIDHVCLDCVRCGQKDVEAWTNNTYNVIVGKNWETPNGLVCTRKQPMFIIHIICFKLKIFWLDCPFQPYPHFTVQPKRGIVK